MNPLQRLNFDTSKPTILVVSDSATLHTGLARVTRTIFNYLTNLGKYNIVQLGWFAASTQEQVSFPIIPTRVSPDRTSRDAGDTFGQKTFPELVKQLAPDVVWACADPWNLEHIAKCGIRSRFRLVGYVAIDSPPIRPSDADILQRFDHMVPYCEWGKIAMEAVGINCEAPILHGVDLDRFHPISKDEVKNIREDTMGVSEDQFLFGTFARNIPRKYLPACFQTLYYLRSGNYVVCDRCSRATLFPYDVIHRRPGGVVRICHWCKSTSVVQQKPRPNVRWYYHGALDDAGWNLEELHKRYKLDDAMIFNKQLTVGAGFTDTSLNALYNALDAFVLPTTCEGFGLPVLEAMAAGVPCLITDTTAYREWAHSGTLFIESATPFIEPKLNLERHIPSIPDMVIKCARLIDDEKCRSDIRNGGLHVASAMGWDMLLPKWEALFDEILELKRLPPWQTVSGV